MFKKLLLLFSFILLVACHTKKQVVQSSPKPPKKVIHPKPKTATPPKNNTEVLEATSKVKVTTALVNEYINLYKDVAMKNMTNHGVPASIAMAQAILESGAGTGALCKMANNHFGIKCHDDWQGEGVRFDDDAPQECFRKYETVYDSYQDHANFLLGRRWYEPLFKLEKDDYKGWANGLKLAGYATDPQYAEKLISIIERYELNKFDAQVLGKPFIPQQPKNQSVNQNTNPTQTTQTPTQIVVKDGQHLVIKGDTLYSVSKKYNISIEDLKKKNNLVENTISIGQILIVK